MRLVLRALSMLVFVVSCTYAFGDEIAARRAIQTTVQGAFNSDDFQALEDIYKREFNSVTPSGIATKGQIVRALWELRFSGNSVGSVAPSGNDGLSQYRANQLEFSDKMDAKAASWVKRFPESTFAAISQSSFLVAHAFAFRGNGSGSSVPSSDMQAFRQYVDQAQNALLRLGTSSKDPAWYFQMLTVARLSGWEQAGFLEFFDQASKIDPYYVDTYFAASEFFLPQWGGSAKQIAALADFAVKTTQAKYGSAMYARVYWNLADSVRRDFFAPANVNWKKMKRGFDDLTSRYPEPVNWNAYARFACLAEDRAAAKLALERIKQNVVHEAWLDRDEYNQCNRFAESGEKLRK